IDASQLVTNNLSINSTTNLDAGGISIQATQSVILSHGSELVSSTNRPGNAGEILIETPGNVTISGGSSISTDAFPNAQGNAGGVGIAAGSFLMTENSVISTSTATSNSVPSFDSISNIPTNVGSSAGAVILLIDGNATLDKDSYILNNLENRASGTGGDVIIAADSLSVFHGSQIQTIVRGNSGGGIPARGNGGKIFIIANKVVRVEGTGTFPSLISTRIDEGATGEGGKIFMQANSLHIRDHAEIDSANTGSGPAGDIALSVRGIWLDNDALISTQSYSGNGGNIFLDTFAVILGRNSDISATAGKDGAGGTGGNIAIGRGNVSQFSIINSAGRPVSGYIFDDRAFLLAGKTPSNNNILAKADFGTGGNIRITINALQEIAQRIDDFPTTNDITTKSSFGTDGTTVVNTLDVFPSLRTNPLPERYEVPKVSQGCDPRDRQESSRFIVTGRGGLPVNPAEVLNQDTLAGTDSPPRATIVPAPGSQTGAIVPAQGWVRKANGTIHLTAYATDPTSIPSPYPFWSTPASCYVP
ncbi:MAG: hypothetical protein WCA35_24030, partial [Kovacikia sp.]